MLAYIPTCLCFNLLHTQHNIAQQKYQVCFQFSVSKCAKRFQSKSDVRAEKTLVLKQLKQHTQREYRENFCRNNGVVCFQWSYLFSVCCSRWVESSTLLATVKWMLCYMYVRMYTCMCMRQSTYYLLLLTNKHTYSQAYTNNQTTKCYYKVMLGFLTR